MRCSPGFLIAVEFNDQRGSGGRVRFRHYPSLSALRAGRFDRKHTSRSTLSRCNEGTPQHPLGAARLTKTARETLSVPHVGMPA